MKELTPNELGQRVFVPDEWDEYLASSYFLISLCRLEETGGHDHIHIWNRGAKAGTITVNKGEGYKIIERLLGK